MWTWGFIEALIGGSAAAICLFLALAEPKNVNPLSIVGVIIVGLYTLVHGLVYIRTSDRIKKLEEYVHLQVTNPEVLEKAKRELLYPDNPVDDEEKADPSSSEADLIAKLNSLDPQSRRVVESVIEAESKRAAE